MPAFQSCYRDQDKMDAHSGPATLPRAPTTPEPSPFNGDAGGQIPAPPRPRLRLKRRIVSAQLNAPTQQFLASVAAADVPIPSIEEPAHSQDFDMVGLHESDRLSSGDHASMLLSVPRGRAFSPPKTPAPGFVPSLSPTRYPNWTIDSTISSSVESTPDPDYESSRPSTSHSTQTSASLFSHMSQASNEDQCVASPDLDGAEKYLLSFDDEADPHATIRMKGKATARKAPWTKAMSDHLWATYVLYLQDPKVTPFRMGKSCLPPHGVCLRVAREARRSWKGTKALTKAANPTEGRKSGSSTPTAENAGAFMEWPHTTSSTRAHLRELCKLKAASGAKNQYLMSRSPTPFTQAAARHWNRRSTPASQPSAFATQDMSLSLALSTSESMQPQGPLAQLTRSTPEPARLPEAIEPLLSAFDGEPSFAERRRLGSPIGAKSYGPSSSGSLATAFGLGSPMPRRQTIGPRRTLQSPVRMSRTGTVKRRNTQSSEPRKRPTIVPELFTLPTPRPQADAASSFRSSSSDATGRDALFVPRISAEPLVPPPLDTLNAGEQRGLVQDLPPRLGSPFSVSNTTSFSFPNRLHRMQPGSIDLGMLSRPFATIQQAPEPPAPSVPRINLAGRLAYLDQRLKELRTRGAAPRSESPL